MSLYKVRSNIPIPECPAVPALRKYPFNTMAVGQSFFMPKVRLKRVRGALYTAAVRSKIKITVRSFVQDGVKGVMVWRVA